jgi:hypothetical protein
MADRPRAFLDANVLRGQLTTDVLLTLAHERLFTPKWSAEVLQEVKRNRPDGVTAERINSRFSQMNKVFPAAMTSDYEGLVPEMRADEKDKHVLAAAVHSRSTVLVSENTKDFDPPSNGPNAIRIERTSDFLNGLLADNPDRVVAAMDSMVKRNRREPQTMPELIDKMASQADLKRFAHKLNEAVPEDERGTLTSLQTAKSTKAARDGLAPPTGAGHPPSSTSEAGKAKHRSEMGKGLKQEL